MSEKTKANGKQGGNDAMKTFGTSLGAGVVGGVTTGLLTPVQAFPKASDIEEDLDAIPVEAVEDTDTIEVADNVDVIDDAVPTMSNDSTNVVMNINIAPTTLAETEVPEEEPVDVLLEEPALEDDYMAVASGVDDSMSFSQAFAAARTEVGPGGLFTWHGNTYGTYYADEWNNMSAEEKEQYWADVHHTTEHLNDLALNEEPTLDPIDEDPLAYDSTSDDLDSLDSYDDENEENYALDDHDDLDLMASNSLDPDIPIDNNMDMSAFA